MAIENARLYGEARRRQRWLQASSEVTCRLLSGADALSNAARHARADRVSVTVEVGRDLVVVVRDNGSGMQDSTRRSGLANLAERPATGWHAARGARVRRRHRVALAGTAA